MTPAALDAFGDEPVFGTLPDGRLLPIPASRLKAMLEALYELFASRRIDDDGQAAPVPGRGDPADRARDAPCPTARSQWVGGEQPARDGAPPGRHRRDPARRSSRRAEGHAAPLPGGRAAPGCSSWAACGLSGVLADDMGLGKTVQALAHILAEKEAGRLNQALPRSSAPTSLVPTWRNEARKFAPDLTVLVLHGNERRELFDEHRASTTSC